VRPDVVRRLRARVAGLQLRTRVGILAAVGVGLAVTLTSVAAFVTVRNQLHHQRDQQLLARAEAAVDSPLGDPNRLANIPSAALGAGDVRIAIVRQDAVGFSAPGSPQPPANRLELAVARGTLRQALFTDRLDAEEFRVVAVPAGDGLALVLAQSTTEVEKTLDRLGLVLLLVGAVGVAVAAYAGALIARTGLRPVRRLSEAAERVAETQRLDPIEVSGNDEIARLTLSFNAMLAALGASRDRERALVADAGHELRTPLTSLRTNLDLLAQSDRTGGLSADDRAELLADVRAQVLELSELVGDLVELARDEPPAPAQEPVDLAEVVARSVHRVERRAPSVTFRTETERYVVDGDPAMLERAVTNLLDNAAKWSPSGATVWTRLKDGQLQVRDEGPGIAPDDLPRVFDRFYRSPEARSLPGSGLGLAIVKHTVEGHGGQVWVTPAAGGGTIVTLRLPASSTALGPVSGSSQGAHAQS
jgi:two-component system, OmpR family, sensor histidine kinase MprB